MAQMRKPGIQEWQRQQAALAREAERHQRAADAENKRQMREAAQQRSSAGSAEADLRTRSLSDRVEDLSSILPRGLRRSARIDVRSQRQVPRVPPLDLHGLDRPLHPPNWEEFAPRAPGTFGRLFGGDARYTARRCEAEAFFAQAQEDHREQETKRQTAVKGIRREHAQAAVAARNQAEAANQLLDQWAAGLAHREREAVERYLRDVLRTVALPFGFPHHAEIAYNSRDEQVVLQVELPDQDVIPDAKAITYVKARDDFVVKPRPEREQAALYRLVISQVILLVVRDLFDSDPRLRSISINGHVRTISRATGRPDYPCLLSLMVDRQEWAELVLTSVSPEDCLRHLRALVSAHPYAVEPVRPLVDFDRSRYAFIEGIDVVADLDHRDDVMTLTPTEFEHLVRQVFESAPGMQGWTTRPSKDDGVDAVIFNDTPITGGLTVVQAKQYSKAIGVQHVRELLGTMEDKKAGRGVLVTTSTFTKGCHELADRLGRIQLIDGPGFVYMIKELLDKDVIIGQRPPRP